MENVLKRTVGKVLNVEIMVRQWLFTAEYKGNKEKHISKFFLCDVVGQAKETEYWDLAAIDIQQMDAIKWKSEYKDFVSKLKLNIKVNTYELKELPTGDLYSFVSNKTKSIDLMNTFEGLGNSKRVFKRIVLRNDHKVVVGDHLCKYHLIIERYSDCKHTVGNITFTQFKAEDGKTVYQYCDEEYVRACKIRSEYLKVGEFYFYEPFRLRAQNKTDREGYGWIWDWRNGIGTSCPGTYYGATTNYAFVGIKIVWVYPLKKIKEISVKNSIAVV